jgi:hypothetical protein
LRHAVADGSTQRGTDALPDRHATAVGITNGCYERANNARAYVCPVAKSDKESHGRAFVSTDGGTVNGHSDNVDAHDANNVHPADVDNHGDNDNDNHRHVNVGNGNVRLEGSHQEPHRGTQQDANVCAVYRLPHVA